MSRPAPRTPSATAEDTSHKSLLTAHEQLVDPYGGFGRIREETRIARGIWGGSPAWFITRYDDANAVLADRARRPASRPATTSSTSASAYAEQDFHWLRTRKPARIVGVNVSPVVALESDNWHSRGVYAERLEQAGFTDVDVQDVNDRIYEPNTEYMRKRCADALRDPRFKAFSRQQTIKWYLKAIELRAALSDYVIAVTKKPGDDRRCDTAEG